MQTTRSRLQIGDYIVEPRLNRIAGPQGDAVVEPKVMHVLLCLAEDPGAVFTKDALIESVWEGTVVTDYVVSRSISQLRKIFDDSFRSPTYIETVSKTGYRLIAPVSDIEEGSVLDVEVSRYGDSHPQSADSIEVVPSPAAQNQVPSSKQPIGWKMPALLLAVAVVCVWMGKIWMGKAPAEPLPSRLFTSSPGLEMSPVFSPDGSMVAFLRYHPDTQYDVYVKMIDADAELRLTDDPGSDIYASWSPDGQYVAFQRIGAESCGIYLIPAIGGEERKLLDCKHYQRNLDWSPDGSAFAVIESMDEAPEMRVSLIDIETHKRTPVTTPPPAYSDFLPAFSPDGRQIAFCRGFHGQMADLHVVSVDGGETRRLTFDNRDIAGFSWTPDGSALVFSSNRTGEYRLWRVDAAGGDVSWLSNIGTLDPGSPAFSPTGEHMAFEEWTFELNIWETVVNPATPDEEFGQLTRRFVSTRSDFQPHYSPDGKRVTFVSNRSGRPELWVGASDGSQVLALASLDGAYLHRPRWSPDGRQIVFDAFVDGYTHIYMVDAEGGRPQRLSQEDAEHRLPDWSRDGQWIYFTSNREDGWQVWKMPAAGGPIQRVTQQGGYLAQEAPDGSLYYSKLGEVGIWRQGAGSDEELTVAGLQSADWGNWAVAHNEIFYIGRTAGTVKLVRQHLATAATDSIFSFPRFSLSYESGLAVSPDGSRLLLARTDKSESDIVLVEMGGSR